MNTVIPLITVWLAHFIVDFMVGIWSVFKTISALDIGVAGLIAGLCGFLGEGSQLLFGSLTDRGYKKILVVLGLILSSGSALLGYMNGYFLFFIMYLFTCLGSGAFHPPAVSLVGGLTQSKKGLFIAIFATGGSLGMACSQIVFSSVHSRFGGDTAVLLVPALALALLCLLFGYWKKDSQPASMTKRPAFGLEMFRTYFQNRSLKMLYITQVFNQTISWAAIFILPDILASRGYEPEIAFGGGHFVYIMGGVLMMIPSGFIADRYSARSVILTANFLGMILIYTFLSMPFLPVAYLLPLLAAAGAALGILQPVSVALGNKIGKEHPGLVGAFTMGLVWCVSEMAGPGGVGLLSQFFTEDAPAKALMGLCMLYPVAIFAAFQLPREEKTPELAKVDVTAVE